MVKTNNLKTVGKKIISFFLALLMALSCFASIDLSAMATTYNDSKEIYLGNQHTRIRVKLSDGSWCDAFCINWGTTSTHSGTLYSSETVYIKYWMKLSGSKRNKIESIIAYAKKTGYINTSETDYGNETYFGVQMAIWYYTDGFYGPTKWSTQDIVKGDSYRAQKVCDDCLDNVGYNPSSDKIEFEEPSPFYIKESNNYVGTDMVSNISSGAGYDGVDLADWEIDDIELNTTAEESGAKTSWLSVDWVNSNGKVTSSESARAGIQVSSSQVFKGRMGIIFKSKNIYFSVTKNNCCQCNAQQIVVAGEFSTKTCKLNVRCEDDVPEMAGVKIVKIDDDGNRIRTGVRYRIYTNKDDAVTNNAYDDNKNLNDSVVRGVWTDDNGDTHAYLETDEDGRVTSESVLEVGTTYYIRECGYYGYNEETGKYEYIELTKTEDSDDDAEVEVISNDDSAYVTNSYYRKTKAITITSDDVGEVIRIGNAGNKIKDEDRSTDDYNANWVNIRKRGDLRIEKYDEHDNPVSGITFMLTDGANINLIGETNANGVLYFCNVPTGEYSLVEYSNDNYDVTDDYPNASYTWVNGSNETVEGNYTFEDSTDFYGAGTMQALITIEWDQQTSYDDAGKNSVSNVYSEIKDYYNGGHVVRLYVTNDLIERGDLAITKLQENGRAFEGVTFTLTSTTDSTISVTGTTGSDGKLYFANFPVGTYYLTESLPNNNVYPSDENGNTWGSTTKEVTISWDNCSTYDTFNTVNTTGDYVESANPITITVNNRVQRGDLKIHKYVEQSNLDNNYQGGTYEDGAYFEITIHSNKDDNELGVELTFTTKTDAYGDAYFCDIPIGTYTVTETNLDSKYVAYVTDSDTTNTYLTGNKLTAGGYSQPNDKQISDKDYYMCSSSYFFIFYAF